MTMTDPSCRLKIWRLRMLGYVRYRVHKREAQSVAGMFFRALALTGREAHPNEGLLYFKMHTYPGDVGERASNDFLNLEETLALQDNKILE